MYGQVSPPYGTKPVEGANGLYLFSYDEPEKLNRPDAVCACQNKGDGWRLPTLNELQVLASQNAGLTTGNTYWTMDKVVGKLDFYAVSANGKVKTCAFSDKNSIRCVWSPYVAATETKPAETVSEPVTKPVTEQGSNVAENKADVETTPAPIAEGEQQKEEKKAAEPQTKSKDEEKPVQSPKVKEEKEKAPKENIAIFSEKFPYKHSLGLVVGNINGISYKTFIKDHFAIELDLAGFEVSLGVPFDMYWAAPVLNLNFLYQGQFTKGLYGIAGGGINIGYELFEHGGKAGAGALLGLEYVFEKPVSLQFDFRPGYGCVFDDIWDYHFFDWAVCLSVRYVFK